ncbi:MAG: hypothetical protein ACXQTP_02060 [Candidatus Methanofastidiosia archaeon]
MLSHKNRKKTNGLPKEFLPVLMKHAKKHLKEDERRGLFRKLTVEK